MVKANNQLLENTPSVNTESVLFQLTECQIKNGNISNYVKKLQQILAPLIHIDALVLATCEDDSNNISLIYSTEGKPADKKALYQSKTYTAEQLRKSLIHYTLKSGRLQHLSAKKIHMLIKKNIIDSTESIIQCWLGIPLFQQDNLIGALAICNMTSATTYNENNISLIKFLSHQICQSITNISMQKALEKLSKKAEEKVRKRTEELNNINQQLKNEIQQKRKIQAIQSALFQISELVITSKSLKDFYESVHTIVNQLMHAKNMYIGLLSEDKEYIDLVYFVDEKDKSPLRIKLRNDLNKATITEKIFVTGEIILENSHNLYEADIGSASSSYLGMPLKDDNQIFGVIAIQDYSETECYTENDKNLFLTISRQIALAILRKQYSESLKFSHMNLENRVKQRTRELEKTIHKRKLVEEKLIHESLHDALTGLPNRLRLLKEVNKLLELSDKTRKHTLLFLDLDRFKIINDSLGHHIGDLFLIQVANRIKQCLRTNDLVARHGGDEFCILMPDIPQDSIILQVCDRILKSLKTPVEVNNHSLITSASIGIRMITAADKSANIILSDADAAMYKAKSQGKNCYYYFDRDIKEIVNKRMQMENDLRVALKEKQFFLVYQPLIDSTNHTTVGFEALLRWHHPEKGLVGPYEFIPIAEETGLIVEIGELVIKMACETLKKFESIAELSKCYININASSVQILSRQLDQTIRTEIVKKGILAEKLNIEITESVLIEDYSAALNFVRELRSMGMKIYLDDFGTGFSSLSYLHKFPFDAIKLDRSFINGLNENQRTLAIVESTAILAHNLGISIVAEGVETKEQADMLADLNFDTFQGYYFSKPITYEEVLKRLK